MASATSALPSGDPSAGTELASVSAADGGCGRLSAICLILMQFGHGIRAAAHHEILEDLDRGIRGLRIGPGNGGGPGGMLRGPVFFLPSVRVFEWQLIETIQRFVPGADADLG